MGDVQWEDAKTFVDDDTSLAVRVRVLPLRRPKYSYEIGVWHDDRFKRHLMPKTRTRNAQVELEPLDIEVLKRLMAQAEHFIWDALQDVEDRWIAFKQARELKQINRGKQEVRKTGKTARKKAKKRAG